MSLPLPKDAIVSQFLYYPFEGGLGYRYTPSGQFAAWYPNLSREYSKGFSFSPQNLATGSIRVQREVYFEGRLNQIRRIKIPAIFPFKRLFSSAEFRIAQQSSLDLLIKKGHLEQGDYPGYFEQIGMTDYAKLAREQIPAERNILYVVSSAGHNRIALLSI